MSGRMQLGHYVRGGLKNMRRSCYKILLRRLRTAEDDFIAYLNLSLSANLTYPPFCCLHDIYNWVQHRFSTASRASSP